MSKVIVIGSGLGGLTTAYVLLKNGYDVTILEQGMQAGGCLQCFTRKGVKFETGMHFIGSALPGQTMHKMMNYFGLFDDVTLSQLDTTAYNTISLAGQEFEFANGREPFIEKMASYFPKEKDNLRKYVGIIDKIASASTLNSLTSDQRDMAANTEYQLRSINEVLDELFDDELLKNVLVGDLPLYAAERDKTPFSQHAFIMDFYNQSAFRVEGGSDAIARSLIKSIEKMGGELLTKKKVTKIHCDDTHATGVETQDECFYPADYVISTIHPTRLLELLDTKLIRPAFRTRINNIPNTAAGFAVYVKFKENAIPYMNTNYYGYKSDSPWNCEHYGEEEWPKGFLYMHNLPQPLQRRGEADRTESPSLGGVKGGHPLGWVRGGSILSYMNMQDVSRWKGTSVGHRGADYEEFKRQHAERLIAEVEKHKPGFAAAIDCYFTSTPLTYLDYTGTEGGSMYGVAKDISLGAAGRVPYRTKIPNLLLAGQNVNSHGMMGVIVGTIVTCQEIMKFEL